MRGALDAIHATTTDGLLSPPRRKHPSIRSTQIILQTDSSDNFRRPAPLALQSMVEGSTDPVIATMTLDGQNRFVDANSVVGVIPGNGDETILIQSHHDSAFNGAVEDGSGTAELLALATYYAQAPADQRTRRLLFQSMDTHFTDYESHQHLFDRFVNGPEDFKIVAQVGVEHIGLEAQLDETGQIVMTGLVEPRLLFVSPSLLDLVISTVEAHDYRRTVTFSTEFSIENEFGLSTDVWVPNLDHGVPVISLISAPIYLYAMQDSLDRIAVEELQPTAALFVDIIDQINTMSEIPLDRTFLDRCLPDATPLG